MRIAVIGGGPGGLMLARLLQLRGIAATVFERDAHRFDSGHAAPSEPIERREC